MPPASCLSRLQTPPGCQPGATHALKLARPWVLLSSPLAPTSPLLSNPFLSSRAALGGHPGGRREATHPRPHDIEQRHKDHSWGLRLLVRVLCPAPTPEPAGGLWERRGPDSGWAVWAAGRLPISVQKLSWALPVALLGQRAGSSESWAAAQRERKGASLCF